MWRSRDPVQLMWYYFIYWIRSSRCVRLIFIALAWKLRSNMHERWNVCSNYRYYMADSCGAQYYYRHDNIQHTLFHLCMGFNQFIFQLCVEKFMNSFELLVWPCTFLDGLHSAVALSTNFFVPKLKFHDIDFRYSWVYSFIYSVCLTLQAHITIQVSYEPLEPFQLSFNWIVYKYARLLDCQSQVSPVLIIYSCAYQLHHVVIFKRFNGVVFPVIIGFSSQNVYRHSGCHWAGRWRNQCSATTERNFNFGLVDGSHKLHFSN